MLAGSCDFCVVVIEYRLFSGVTRFEFVLEFCCMPNSPFRFIGYLLFMNFGADSAAMRLSSASCY